MHRAKGDRFVRASGLPVRQWTSYNKVKQVLMDFPLHIDSSMGLPIVYFKGSQVEVFKL